MIWLRKIRYLLEGSVIVVWFAFFWTLPLDMASALGGLLGRIFGPFSGAHRTADHNLLFAMPELSLPARRKILGDMWENLGRVAGEYPHLSTQAMAKRITIEGREHFEAIKDKGALFASGHFANWEIAPLTAALCGQPLTLIYRAANNPISDWLIRTIRKRFNRNMHNKGREGAQGLLKALRDHEAVGLLVDQKMNDGSPLPFFGHDAMTATAPAQLAIKFQVPVLTARVVRTDGAHFHITILPPLHYEPNTDPKIVMTHVNQLFEQWIREYPAQWLWVHRRWGKIQ